MFFVEMMMSSAYMWICMIVIYSFYYSVEEATLSIRLTLADSIFITTFREGQPQLQRRGHSIGKNRLLSAKHSDMKISVGAA